MLGEAHEVVMLVLVLVLQGQWWTSGPSKERGRDKCTYLFDADGWEFSSARRALSQFSFTNFGYEEDLSAQQ